MSGFSDVFTDGTSVAQSEEFDPKNSGAIFLVGFFLAQGGSFFPLMSSWRVPFSDRNVALRSNQRSTSNPIP
jgi:hypothetical protein